MDMENFVHAIPTEIYFGKGMISNLADLLNRYGKNVLLVYGGGSIKRTGLYDNVIDILKKNENTVTECAGVEPNPRIETVKKGVDLCHQNHIDVILAVGGGSVIDCAKAIAAGVYYEGEDLWEMVIHADHHQKALPLVDILTLSATGSEFDDGAVISNMALHEKVGGVYTFPKASICDPTYTYTVPASQTAAGSADIMSHVMEGYFSRTDDADLSEAMEEGILKSVIKNLPIALKEPDNYSARANLMYDSDIACSQMPAYGKLGTGWPCHGMEHELSAFYDITHGVGLAILTPRWMRYILKKDPTVTPRFARFARNVWNIQEEDDNKAAVMGIDALADFFYKTAGIPSSLSALGIDDKNFKVMAEHAVSSNDLTHGYVPLTPEDVVEIYKDCL